MSCELSLKQFQNKTSLFHSKLGQRCSFSCRLSLLSLTVAAVSCATCSLRLVSNSQNLSSRLCRALVIDASLNDDYEQVQVRSAAYRAWFDLSLSRPSFDWFGLGQPKHQPCWSSQVGVDYIPIHLGEPEQLGSRSFPIAVQRST